MVALESLEKALESPALQGKVEVIGEGMPHNTRITADQGRVLAAVFREKSVNKTNLQSVAECTKSGSPITARKYLTQLTNFRFLENSDGCSVISEMAKNLNYIPTPSPGHTQSTLVGGGTDYQFPYGKKVA